jgi:predicted dienelactone hydrolase
MLRVLLVAGALAAGAGLMAAASGDREPAAAPAIPDGAAGQQLRWLTEARLPLSATDMREHFSAGFRASAVSARRTEFLGALAAAHELRLRRLLIAKPAALAAVVQRRGGGRLVVTIFADRAGQIDYATLGPAPVLPRPTGGAEVGSDRVELVDRARANRRLMLTRWYPSAGPAGGGPAQYGGARLAAALADQYADDHAAAAAALALPAVVVHARAGARARPGRLPVVLFSPGGGASRVLYQSVAEDLASHGYLVVSVDHTGEAAVELPDGTIIPPAPLGDQTGARLADMRLVLRRLNTMASGPRADRRRVAAIGHSLGGSTAAALMRAEPAVRAGVDIDGIVLGPAARRGVPRAFMVMSAGKGALALPSVKGLLAHSRGPRLALQFAGFEHFSFSDAPVIAPRASGLGERPSARDIAAERAYLRAFLDRYVRGRPAPLLAGPSPLWPQVSFRYRQRCCGTRGP